MFTPTGRPGRGRLGGDLKLLPPCEPKTISALAFNYKDLVGERDEYDEPLVFLKAVSAGLGHRQCRHSRPCRPDLGRG